MKRYQNPRGTALFIFIAAVLMTFSHLFFYDGVRFVKGVPRQVPVEVAVAPVSQSVPHVVLQPVYYDHPLFAEFNPEALEVPAATIEEPPKKAVPEYSLKNPNPNSPARIAIIIDDMGVNRKLSKAMIAFEGAPLTLAFLPYADGLSSLTEPARKNGHELMIHMPMEPMNSKIDTGAIALKDGMGRDEVDGMLKAAFESFDGYAGLNNHMGSRLTQDAEKMSWVMEALANQDLFFVDSKTIPTSIAADKAKEAGLDYAVRDVFLDHENTRKFVTNALRKTEEVALRKGYAIAIGHPKVVTLAGLQAWVPTLKERGFEIVPVSELLLTPEKAVIAEKEEGRDSQVKTQADLLLEAEATPLMSRLTSSDASPSQSLPQPPQ